MGLILNSLQEKRSHPSTPAKWLIEYFSGRDCNSGVAVTETSALYSTAVFACIRLLSDTLAALPFPVYKRLDRGKEKAREHPVYKLMQKQANPEMASYLWKEVMQSHILGWGNAYSEIEWARSGEPKALWLLRPDKTWPERDKNTKELIYKTQINGTEYTLRKEQVLHIPGLGFDGIRGYSPIQLVKEAVGLSLATEEFGARYFGSGTHPGVVVSHPGVLKPEGRENLKTQLTNAYSGLGRSHRLMLMEEGMKIENIGIPPEDSQFLETRKFQVNEIARFYGVPPHMIGDLERSTNNNIEEQGLEYVIYTLQSNWLVRWEQIISMKLIPEEQQDIYFSEFLVDGLLRGDSKSRAEYYSKMFNIASLSPNDIREKENMNPVEGGDKCFVPVQLIPLDKAEELPVKPDNNLKEPKKDDDLIKKSFEGLINEATLAINNREKVDFTRIYERFLKNKDMKIIENYLEFYENDDDFAEKRLMTIAVSYAILTRKEISEAEKAVKSAVIEHKKALKNRIIEVLKSNKCSELIENWESTRMGVFLSEGVE